MTLSIRNPDADALARRLAELEGSSITDAVIVALKEAVDARVKRESPTETARRILAKYGLSVQPGRQPVPDSVYHDLDHDLTQD